jgi:hypothetical protein
MQSRGGAQWRARWVRTTQGAGLVFLGTGLVLMMSPRVSAASPSVNIPSGPFSNGQTVTVSGSGFPAHSQDLTGLQIIECSDPGGSAANLPIDAASGCEGTTVNPGQINTDTQGRFQSTYQIQALSSAVSSSINCDATHQCVLWAGTDYNNAFLSGPHAFSRPFTIVGSVTPSTTSAPAASSTTTAAPSVQPSSASPSSTSTPAGTSPSATAAGTSSRSGTSAGASLASTGLPQTTTWLLGAGLLMTLVGLLGRRLTAGRRVGVGSSP